MAAAAVKVYGWAMSPFVVRALLCLEEAGVEYELVAMNPEAGDHLRPDFLARNPFAQVPVLEDGDLTLFESRAIARHVLRKHKPELLAGDGSPEAAAMVDVWLEVEAHQHHGPTGAIVTQCIAVPLRGDVRDQAVVDENVAKLRKVLEVYEARLSASRYLAGESLTLADRPQPLPHDGLLHGDRVRGAGGGAAPCEGVVGGAQGQALGEEGHGARRSCRPTLVSGKRQSSSELVSVVTATLARRRRSPIEEVMESPVLC